MTSRSTVVSRAVALAATLGLAGAAPGEIAAQEVTDGPLRLPQLDAAPQETPTGPAPDRQVGSGPVLTLDQDALFAGSAFGRRVQQELQRDRAALAQENRRIEAELVEEELALTRQRQTTSPGEFAALANAFDEKVQQVRETQDGKSFQLQQRLDRERQTFLTEAGPVIANLVRQRGASVVIDRSVILLALEGVDITQDAIAAIDAAIGRGGGGEKLTPPSRLPGSDGADEGDLPRSSR